MNFDKDKVIGWDEKNQKDILLGNDIQVTTADTLVVRDRESNKKVFFSPMYTK